ncbi:MAG: polymer-forming cytoskeletal protein [Bacillota bacterium]|nr:polymer-forming cytoskeletal protein [Bacillota bacterium]
MGLFGKKEEAPVVEVPVVEEVIEKPINGTVIAEGITFVGDFVTEEDLELKGTIKGDIVSPKHVHIDKTGYHKGTINACCVEIDGTVDADIECQTMAKLNSTAKVLGDLKTSNIEAASGSEFSGKLELKPAAKCDKACACESEEDVPVTEEDIFGK